MAALATPAALEAARLKYQPDSKYRHKRVAIPSATDTYGDTEADHTKYQNKRARVEDGSGPNERMFTAFLEASRSQHQQEIASLEAHNHQKQVEVADLKSECHLRLSSSDQAWQQMIQSVKKQADDEINSLRDHISQLQSGGQQLLGENQCLARTVNSRDTEILNHIAKANDASQKLAEAQAICLEHEQKAWESRVESDQLADENALLKQKNTQLAQEKSQLATNSAELLQELEGTEIRLEQESDRLTVGNIALKQSMLAAESEAKKCIDALELEVQELKSEVLVHKSNEEELTQALQKSQNAHKKEKSEHNTFKENVESGVYEMSNSFQTSNFKTKEKRRAMPAEVRKDEKMKAARSKSGSAAPKGIQKTKGVNKKALKKVIVNYSDNEDEESLVNKLAGSANGDDSESFNYARRSGRGLDATFGIITPPDSAESSMVE